MARRKWFALGWRGCFAAAALIIGIWLVFVLMATSGIIEDWLPKKVTHQGQPISHWRELLRGDGEAGTVRPETVEAFRGSTTAVPMLAAMTQDPDPKVRWVAVSILGRVGGAREVIPVLTASLNDAERSVRFHAAAALSNWRGDARSALAALVEVAMHDPDLGVADAADFALWEIHTPTAIEAGGWREFKAAKYNTAVMFRGEPEETEETAQHPMFGPIKAHGFKLVQGLRAWTLTVSEPPAEFFQSTTEEERFEGLRTAVSFIVPEGTITDEKPIKHQGHPGREFVIRSKMMGKLAWMRNRSFWVGERLYGISSIWFDGGANPRATEYFLDSLRLPEAPRSPESKPTK